MFRFRRFAIEDSRSSMKVGTDAVLLGAWCDIEGARQILDIGTGSGIVALMATQRSNAQITAIDIDEGSVADAILNASASPWCERISVELCPVEQHKGVYDHILSNPPFFTESLTPPVESRCHARHTTRLDFETLCASAASMLTADGRLTVIIPYEMFARFADCAREQGLFVGRRLDIKPKPDKEPKRILIEFSHREGIVSHETLTIELDARHSYSQQYIALTKDFYLNM